ncbi:MAG TPA: phosphodiester glycosidase family protein [Acidimicrobiales bacterium]|nr:phosphodiester glycosidase family protein [Acidimicrobiales bacterium]
MIDETGAEGAEAVEPTRPPDPRRRRKLVALAVVVALLVLPSRSFAIAMSAPGDMSPSEKAVEWLRDHGLGSVVNGVQHWWYSSHPPKKGGTPSHRIGVASPPGSWQARSVRTHTTVAHTPAPADLVSPAAHPVPDEGHWLAVGPRVDGIPTMYETQIRPDAVHTSILDGLVWMDPKLLRFALHPGLDEPGGTWTDAPDVPMDERLALVAAFNGGFRQRDSGGGFYLDGRTAAPLVDGAASLVIDRDGTATVAQWGRDVSMSSDVVAVRQDLHLIVDHGRVVPGLAHNAHDAWGDSVGQDVLVWRSGVCVDGNGGVIYAYGDGLSAMSLAGILQRAGCVRAMELDVYPTATTFNFYGAVESDNPASVLGAKMLPNQDKPGDRYLSPDSRDFVAVFERRF